MLVHGDFSEYIGDVSEIPSSEHLHSASPERAFSGVLQRHFIMPTVWATHGRVSCAFLCTDLRVVRFVQGVHLEHGVLAE